MELLTFKKFVMKGPQGQLRPHDLYVIPVLVEFAARLGASSNGRIKLDARFDFLLPSPRISRNGISNRGRVMGKWGRIQNEGGAKVRSRVRRGRRAFYILPFSGQLHLHQSTISTHSPPSIGTIQILSGFRLGLAHNWERRGGGRVDQD